jgi:hypothetical protein
MRESQIEKKLVNGVKAIGGSVFKVRFLGHRGAPDRLVLFNGASYWVELKRPGKDVEEHQKRTHGILRRAGGAEVAVIDTMGEVDGFLAHLWYKGSR